MWLMPPMIALKAKLYTGYESHLKIVKLGSNEKLDDFSKKVILIY